MLKPEIKHIAKWRSKRVIFLVLAILLCSLAVLVVVSLSWLEQDRVDLAARFSQNRLNAITDVAGEVESDIQDIAEDLSLAARLIKSVSKPETHDDLLEAIISVVKAYRAFIIFDANGEYDLFLTDPRRGGPALESVMPIAEKTVTLAFRDKENNIKISPLSPNSNNAIRVFTIKLTAENGNETTGALCLVVDMNQYLNQFKMVASEAQTHLVLLGPYEEPSQMSSVPLTEVLKQRGHRVEKELPTFFSIVDKMLRGETGTTRIVDKEAKRLGIGNADVIAAYAPVRLDDEHHWSAATFTSMVVLKAHEKAIIMRLGTVSLAVALMLVLLGVYIVVTSRNRALLQERVRHFDEVAHLNEKARKILNSIPIDVVVVSDDGRVTDTNQALLARTAHTESPDRISGLFYLTPTPLISKIESMVKESFASKRPLSLIGERMALYGQDGYYSIHAVPLDPPSPDSSLLLVIEDLSEVKRLEFKLLATEKLATVGILAAGIAHEIGTPLGVVRGRAEYMLGKLAPENPMASGLGIIVEQIDRVVRTIRHLLDFSKPQAAKVIPVDMKVMLDKCAALLKFEASSRKMNLEITFTPNLPFAAADPDQLEQVLVNLIMNALDASGLGDTVEISASVDEKPGELANGAETALRIVISDNGCGIPDENVQQIFDPFFTTKKRGQSTGLGLSIVSQIVRSHDAQIQINSKPGEGTQVVLIWPSVEQKERG